MESNVDEKFYLNDEYVERFKKSRASGKYPFGNEYKVIGTTVGTGQGTNSRHWVYDVNDNVSTLDATMYKQPKQILTNNFRLRKLTPRETYRLMGFSDEDFDKAASTGNSSTQLYKQAGNSIVVNVLVEIYKRLQIAYPNDFTTGMNVISLFSGIGAFEKALDRM